MRQVDESELVWRLRYHLKRVSASMRNGFASRQPEAREQAAQMMAEQLAKQALRGLEVLSDTPIPPGTDLFTRAAYGLGGAKAVAIEPEPVEGAE